MTVKVVTDSSSDLSSGLDRELGITVVPLYVNWEKEGIRESYKDGIEITAEEFYKRLVRDKVPPKTAQPNLIDFLEVYEKLSEETDEIISIHLSQKLSLTIDRANQAKTELQERKKCRIEIVDSQGAIMHLGFLVMFAARLAQAGEKIEEILKQTKEIIPKIHLLGLLDTLEYLRKGGRLGKASVLLGPVNKAMGALGVKPLLTIKEGEAHPVGLVRVHKKIERLVEFVKSFPKVKEVGIEYSTNLQEAEELINKIKSILPNIPLYFSQLSPMLGVHTGPGALVVTLRED